MAENKVFYVPTGHEIELFKKAHFLNWPLLLKGPTGCGKTRFVQHMASELNLDLIEVACHEETSAVDLVGRFILKGGETVWQDGPLVRAMKLGAILYLDEIAEAREDIIVALHPVLDHRRQIYIDKTGETVAAKNDFMIVASYNPFYQSRLKELKPSTKQRFMAIHFNYPGDSEEIKIVQHESALDKNTVEQLIKFSKKIRETKNFDLKETISTRLIIASSKLIKSGIPKRTAVECGIIQALTDDPDTTEALKEIAALYL